MIYQTFRRNSLRIIFFIAAFFYLLYFLGIIRGEVLLFGNSELVSISSFGEIFSALGGPNKVGDGGWYLRIAQELSTQNFVDSTSYWWLRSSSPGLGVIEGIFLKFFGVKLFGYAYLIFLAILWSSLFSLAVGKIQNLNSLILKYVFFLIALQYTGIKEWMLGSGVFFTEALSTPLFLLSLIFTVYASNLHNVTKRSLLIGLSSTFLAMAAFVRGTYLFVSYGYVVFGLLTFLYSHIFSKKFVYRYRFPFIESSRSTSLNLFLVGIGSQVALMPYFIFSKFYLETKFGTLNSNDFHLQYAWIDPVKDPFKSIGAGWLCLINEKYCQKDFVSQVDYSKILFQDLSTFFHFPLEVISSRFKVFTRAWFSSEAPGATGNFDAVIQGILFLAILCLILLCALVIHDYELRKFSSLYLFLILLLIAPLVLTHVEVRFLIPVKMILIFYLLHLSSLEGAHSLLRNFFKRAKVLFSSSRI